MRFASLGSGSRGNALLVEAGETRLLVDCGFGPRELTRRLARLGRVPGDLTAIVVTHEHGDHIGGVGRCATRFGLPVHMTHGTRGAAARSVGAAIPVSVFDSHAVFCIGDICVQPFPVPHDAREPVQFVFSDGRHRVGVLTDTGHITPHIVDMLKGCDALVLECNHDAEMLARSAYPWSLKQRIAGRFGHLDNRSAAELLRQIDGSRLRHLVCAHLSEQNNTPALAKVAVEEALGNHAGSIGVADQAGGFDWCGLD